MSRAFNGTTDKGVIASALLTSLAAGSAFQVSVWAKSTSTTALGMAFSVGSTSSNSPIIALGLDGSSAGDPAYASVRDDAGVAPTLFTTNGYTSGQWHLLTLRNTAANARSLQLDSDIANAASNTSNQAGAFSPTSTAVGILKRTTETNFLAGKISRIAIWRAASSADLPDATENELLKLGANPGLIKSAALVYQWDNDLAPVVGGQSFTFTGAAVDSGDNPTTDSRQIVASTVTSWEVPAGGIGALGFTNTGLGYNTPAGEVLIGDFTNTRIVRASRAGAYIGEIVLAGAPASSVQGVAWDSSDGTFWVSHYALTNGTIRHYDSSGTLLDTFSPGVAVPGPNGLVYDPANDRILAVWDDGVVRGYSCATGTLAETINLELAAGQTADGLAFDANDPTVIWAVCEILAGVPDYIKVFNRSTGAMTWAYSCPFDSEGLMWADGSLWMCADQGFHSGVPNGNRVHKLDVTYVPALSASTYTPGSLTSSGFRPRVTAS